MNDAPKHRKPVEVAFDAGALDAAEWAVISFDKVEFSNLTYPEAADALAKLENEGIAGLCIVTANAAERFRP